MDKRRYQMSAEGKERVGIVGVGRMGLAMLKHLVKHGYAVTACDLDDKQLAKAGEAGAAGVLIFAADVIPDIYRYDRGLVVLVDD